MEISFMIDFYYNYLSVKLNPACSRRLQPLPVHSGTVVPYLNQSLFDNYFNQSCICVIGIVHELTDKFYARNIISPPMVIIWLLSIA